MRQAFFLLAAIALLATVPAFGQGQPNARQQAQRGNDACFSEKEAEAEAEVRTGIQLREILRRCAAVYPEGKTALADWYAFDDEHGDRLRAAVELRRQALDRINAKGRLTHQNHTDAIVARDQPLQINESVCSATYDVVERLKTEKWAGFKYYARLQQNLLTYSIPLCRR